jgi:hypothetical protein
MVGVGAIAGTLSGGYTDAGRAPDQDTSAAPRPAVAAVISRGVVSETPASETPASAASTSLTVAADTPEDALLNTTTIARTPVAARTAQPHEQMPAAAIAMRFPGDWQAASTDNPPQTMAYAAESARQAASGFQLASVNPAAEPQPEPVPMPKRMVRPEKPKPTVLFNDAQLASIKARLRLTRDQEHYWPQVEQALRAISWKVATQSNGRSSRQPLATIDPNSPEVARLKSAAVPLIMSMREDQKQEVRQLAHTMGLKQVASMF